MFMRIQADFFKHSHDVCVSIFHLSAFGLFPKRAAILQPELRVSCESHSLLFARLVVGACGSDLKAIPFLFAQRWSACGRRWRVRYEGLSLFCCSTVIGLWSALAGQI